MTTTPLARLLLDRFRWFDEALRMAQRERLGHEITSAQSLLFADLSFAGARQADLARKLGVSRQAVNELVQGLQRQGLVKVEADPLDGRAKLVYPTAAGKRSITVAHEVFVELEGALERRLGAVAFERLRSTLMDDWGDAAAHAPGTATLPSDRSGGPALRSGRG